MSSLGADEGENLPRTLLTSSELLVTGGTSLNTGHRVLQGGEAWVGKKWSIRSSLTSRGSSPLVATGIWVSGVRQQCV